MKDKKKGNGGVYVTSITSVTLIQACIHLICQQPVITSTQTHEHPVRHPCIYYLFVHQFMHPPGMYHAHPGIHPPHPSTVSHLIHCTHASLIHQPIHSSGTLPCFLTDIHLTSFNGQPFHPPAQRIQSVILVFTLPQSTSPSTLSSTFCSQSSMQMFI